MLRGKGVQFLPAFAALTARAEGAPLCDFLNPLETETEGKEWDVRFFGCYSSVVRS